jgi:hypothetical protein
MQVTNLFIVFVDLPEVVNVKLWLSVFFTVEGNKGHLKMFTPNVLKALFDLRNSLRAFLATSICLLLRNRPTAKSMPEDPFGLFLKLGTLLWQFYDWDLP